MRYCGAGAILTKQSASSSTNPVLPPRHPSALFQPCVTIEAKRIKATERISSTSTSRPHNTPPRTLPRYIFNGVCYIPQAVPHPHCDRPVDHLQTQLPRLHINKQR